jgi:acyl-coenzyme A thioesterase PaaI-like protein
MNPDSPDDPLDPWAGDAAESDHTLARRELGEALRGVLEVLQSTDADAEHLRAAAAHARALTGVLAERTRERPESPHVSGMGDFMDRGPVTGRANPIAPPFRLWPDAEARVARGEGRFGSAYEGGPGLAHGGFVAAVLDEALGMATIFSGGPGMTGELTIRYRRPTPLHRDLTVEARLDSQSGRRLAMSGELRVDDEVVAEATGTFVSVPDTKFAEFDDRRRRDR